MPKDSILAEPTLPEIEDARGPLAYGKGPGNNDIDPTQKDSQCIDTCKKTKGE